MTDCYLRPGDVFAHSGTEYVVEFVNDCRARARCLSRKLKTITNGLTGEVAEFQAGAAFISVSTVIERSAILRNDPSLVSKKKT